MIEINNISKTYGKNLVLNEFNLVCDDGKITCLVGKNGAGKSTLINIIAGLLRPEKGTVKILNKEINPSHRSVLSDVGFVLESPLYVDQFTAYEYLKFLGKMHKHNDWNIRITELIEFFELPRGKKYISEYSTGMKSKISIASAIFHLPKVLILDEPFEGLDIGSYDKLLQYLKEYANRGNTILVTTHQIDVITEISDSIAMIKEGKLAQKIAYSDLEQMAKNRFGTSERSPIKRYVNEIIN